MHPTGRGAPGATVEMNWTLVTCGAFGLLGFLLWLQRRSPGEQVWAAWHAMLDHRLLEGYEDLQQSFLDAQGMLADTLALARRRAEQHDAADAGRIMTCAAHHVARHVPDVTLRLAMWRTVSAAARAVRPLPGLGVLRFRSWRVRVAAALDRIVTLALDAGHRFALRVWVLIRSFGIVERGFTRAASSVSPHTGSAPVARGLRRMETLNQDLASLHQATLQTYRTLLDSILEDPSEHR